jgi:hypothetical protein
VVIAFTAVGAVVAAARPANRVGWAMLVGGVLWSVGGAGVDLAHHGIIIAPGSVSGVAGFAVGGQACRSVGWFAVTLAVPAFFPDVRRIGKRWLSLVLVVVVVASVIDTLTDKQAGLTNLGAWRNPIAPASPWHFVSGLAFLAHVPLSLVATVGVVVWIRAVPAQQQLQRQQLNLLAIRRAILAAGASRLGPGFGFWCHCCRCHSRSGSQCWILRFADRRQSHTGVGDAVGRCGWRLRAVHRRRDEFPACQSHCRVVAVGGRGDRRRVVRSVP